MILNSKHLKDLKQDIIADYFEKFGEVVIHIRTPKMTSSQYAPLPVPKDELQDAIKKYQDLGYTVTIEGKKDKTKIKDYFLENGDRYRFDDKLTASKGWAQVDSSWDAWYHGQWANPIELKYVSYAEGDVCEASFATLKEFLEWINNCSKDACFIGIDGMCNEKLIQAFKDIGLENLLH